MKYVEKSWGHEIWFENNGLYCGKGLFVRYQEWSSKGKFHYHPVKDETFIITYGTLLLQIGEDGHGFIEDHILPAQTSFRVKPGVKHRFTAINQEGCEFVEVSTIHNDDDTIRCYWGTVSGDHEWDHGWVEDRGV